MKVRATCQEVTALAIPHQLSTKLLEIPRSQTSLDTLCRSASSYQDVTMGIGKETSKEEEQQHSRKYENSWLRKELQEEAKWEPVHALHIHLFPRAERDEY